MCNVLPIHVGKIKTHKLLASDSDPLSLPPLKQGLHTCNTMLSLRIVHLYLVFTVICFPNSLFLVLCGRNCMGL
jgi:hypothetical protein